MNLSNAIRARLATACIAVVFSSLAAVAQDAPDTLRLAQAAISQDGADDDLKLAALQALMNAPATRALPIIRKVLDGQHSVEVKSRALFILSQIKSDEAQKLLLSMATGSQGDLQQVAIRMIGIAGNKQALDQLATVYRQGDADIRDSVLNAYLIAGEADRVFDIANSAKTEEDFDRAVRVLAVMGATDALHKLHATAGVSEGLSQAYAIAGDLDGLLRIVQSTRDPEERARAIRNIGIVDGAKAGDVLISLYRDNADLATREAVLQGLLVNGHDKGVMKLFQESNDDKEKQRLLRTLVMMDSELALELVDGLLDGGSR